MTKKILLIFALLLSACGEDESYGYTDENNCVVCHTEYTGEEETTVCYDSTIYSPECI